MAWIHWHIEAECWIFLSVIQAIIDSDHGLSPEQHPAIIWTNNAIFLIEHSEKRSDLHQNTNIFLEENEFEDVVCKMTSSCRSAMC